MRARLSFDLGLERLLSREAVRRGGVASSESVGLFDELRTICLGSGSLGVVGLVLEKVGGIG